MALTPVEIRHLKPAKTLFGGYRRSAIDSLLDEIVVSFEDVWRERADLADEARAEARAITRHARSDHDRLLGEVRRMQSLLRAALAIVDEEPAPAEVEAA
jgi:cell division septum initiation protein DivIVA